MQDRAKQFSAEVLCREEVPMSQQTGVNVVNHPDLLLNLAERKHARVSMIRTGLYAAIPKHVTQCRTNCILEGTSNIILRMV